MTALFILLSVAGLGVSVFATEQMERRNLIPKWSNERYKEELPEYKFFDRIASAGMLMFIGGIAAVVFIHA